MTKAYYPLLGICADYPLPGTDNYEGALTDCAPEDVPCWQQANGEGIRVVDMTDDHLRNALRMLQRAGKTNQDLLGEWKARGHRKGAWEDR